MIGADRPACRARLPHASAILAALLLCAACESRDCYLFRDAGVADEKTTLPLRLLAAHRIVPELGEVIAIRSFRRTSFSKTDSDVFEKLTIALTRGEFRDTIDLASPDVRLRYSFASPSFMAKSGLYGTSAEGRLSVLARDAGRLTAKIEASIAAHEQGTFQGPRVIRVDRTYSCRALPVEDATPWVGRPADDLMEEASALSTMRAWGRFLIGIGRGSSGYCDRKCRSGLPDL